MLDAALINDDIVHIALAGLTRARKALPPKLFYDPEGVRLFGDITRLPEYYLTRTENAVLAHHARDLAALAPQGAALVEYGASDEAKARLLLDAMPGHFAAYVPIDIAEDALTAMTGRLVASEPDVAVYPLCADFTTPLALPAGVVALPKFGFFPGSTIGNLDPEAAVAFLRAARSALGGSARFVVGADLRKSPDILRAAYDDPAGVTAAFNLNLLTRLNREAAADFRLDQFAHRAVWNDQQSRIEMHLVSRVDQTVSVAGQAIQFAAGETIHTENSYKYSVAAFRALARSAGWADAAVWTDPAELFAIHVLGA